MVPLMVATVEGLARIGDSGPTWLLSEPVNHLRESDGGWWVLTGRGRLLFGDGDVWKEIAVVPSGWRPNCVVTTGTRTLVGTSEAHLLELWRDRFELVDSFESAPTREAWNTPWGGPPDVRSADAAGERLYVNVHVGGIVAWDGNEWSATIPQQADVHQVIARNGNILAATARGLAVSADGGAGWEFSSTGLHSTYQRAVTTCDEVVLVSVSTGPISTGPQGRQAAVYRGSPTGQWERCRSGLPEWFSDNIDTFCLSGSGHQAALGTSTGEVFSSQDQGRSWQQVAAGLPRIRAVELVTK